MAGLAFRAATADDKVAAMQLINAAYMAEAFIKMPFAEERISEETYDACIANASEVTELLLAVDSESGAIQGTAMLNPPEGSAAGHGEGSAAAHLGFVAVDPALQSPPPAGPPDLPRHPTRPTPQGPAHGARLHWRCQGEASRSRSSTRSRNARWPWASPRSSSATSARCNT